MLIDSDVFIWAIKEHPEAMKVFDGADTLEISVIAYMEIVQGARSKHELRSFLHDLKRLRVKTIYLNEEISKLALKLVTTFYHSHSVELKDALIGATGVVYGLPLATANYKHFKHIEGLELQVFKP
jgi:predicted nucleic acid-binding protein